MNSHHHDSTPSPPSSPFDTIIVTSPDARAATAAKSGPLQSLLQSNTHTILSTSDPFDIRMGSGGGTIAALSLSQTSDSTLIIHAGGESSRCPTQMALGKAWTSLPLNGRVEDPTHRLISQLSSFLVDLPKGSVVVAASDVLLSLPGRLELDVEEEGGSVVGVAVPAGVQVASHHGVFVVENGESEIGEGGVRVQPVHSFLQKPSVAELDSTEGATFTYGEKMAWIDTGIIIFLPVAASQLRTLAKGVLKHYTEAGLVSLAAQKGGDVRNIPIPKLELYSHLLLALSTQNTRTWTLERTKKVYLNHVACDADPEFKGLLTKVHDALASTTLKVAVVEQGQFIHLGTTRELLEFWVCAPGTNTETDILEPQFKRIAEFGATMGMMRRACAHVDEGVMLPDSCVLINSIVGGSANNGWGNSRGGESGDRVGIQIGSNTVLEHCHILLPDQDPNDTCSNTVSNKNHVLLDIGSNCLVSGVRGCFKTPFHLPSDMVLQMLPLLQKDEEHRWVLLCLGVGDAIKSRDTLYGVSFPTLLEWGGLVEEDLWDGKLTTSSKRTLWNARIHPIVSLGNGKKDATVGGNGFVQDLDWTPLSWIAHFAKLHRSPSTHETNTPNDEIGVRASLAAWKEAPRLSLSQIRDSCDAATEFRARSHLTSCFHFKPIRGSLSRVLLGRCHEACDFELVLDEWEEMYKHQNLNGPMPPTPYLSQTIELLDSIIVESVKQGSYDICGRAFMLLGGLLMDVADSITNDCERLDGFEWEDGVWKQAVGTLRNSGTRDDVKALACERLFSSRDLLLSGAKLPTVRAAYRFCGEQMECAAFALTELCISSSTKDDKYSTPTTMPLREPTPVNQWTIATAPARIDLSGGWSDTPPLSYEHGGAVACLAVTVDGRKPLSARCRATLGGVGVLLVAECREGSTGDLLSRSEVRLDVVEDLVDFRDPHAACALLKCALLCLGLVPIELVDGGVDGCEEVGLEDGDGDGVSHRSNSLQPFVEEFCSRKGVGLELVSTSLLPQGSGMGSSSILGGCVLSALGTCVGLDVSTICSKEDSPAPANKDGDSSGDNCSANGLIRAVLLLEQFLSTGGGWQDQVGGLVGGFKLGLSEAHTLPLQLTIRRMPLSSSMRDALNQRLILIFTGRPRLAKNLLQGVLRRWARRTPEIVGTVRDLVRSAQECAAAVERGDVERLGELLSMYWKQKKVMAGGDSGVEPEVVKRALAKLVEDDVILGGTLCGAGGGGFLVVLTQEGKTMEDAKESLGKSHDVVLQEGAKAFTWHHCCVSEEGVGVKLLDADGERITASYFDLQWHL